MNVIPTLSLVLMIFGAAVMFGIFRRFGPISTPKGMRIFGAAIIVVGFLLGLTQSERTPPPGAETPSARLPAPPHPAGTRPASAAGSAEQTLRPR